MAGSAALLGAGFTAFVFFIWLALGAIVLLSFAFWIWMLVDCLNRRFKKDNDKLAWIIVLVFLAQVGAVVYYFMIKRKKR